MGYRNEVLLVFDPKVNEEFLALEFQPGDDSFKNLLNEVNIKTINPSNNNVLYYWELVKWYDDEEPIRTIMNFLQELNQRRFKYIRIGEDVDDIDMDGILKDELFDVQLRHHIAFKYMQNLKDQEPKTAE